MDRTGAVDARAVASRLGAASLEYPHELRRFERGSMAVVDVAGHQVGRARFDPGWHWSEHVRPAAGTELCEVPHVGCVLAGHLTVRFPDGTRATAGPGDVVVVPPGHDGWVEGDEACVMLDWAGAGRYGR